jgi:hypothetical protein
VGTATGRYGTLARVASAEQASPVTASGMLSGDERVVRLELRYRTLRCTFDAGTGPA